MVSQSVYSTERSGREHHRFIGWDVIFGCAEAVCKHQIENLICRFGALSVPKCEKSSAVSEYAQRVTITFFPVEDGTGLEDFRCVSGLFGG